MIGICQGAVLVAELLTEEAAVEQERGIHRRRAHYNRRAYYGKHGVKALELCRIQ